MLAHKKKVLIIDDDMDILSLLKERLEKDDFECCTAMLPGEGLKKAIEFNPDVVLLDLMLPKMSGFGFIREFKHHKELADIPVVVLTSVSDEEVAEEALHLGAVSYLTKGCSTKELVSVIHEYAR